MAFIKRLCNQNWPFPSTIADLIGEDHICRLVDGGNRIYDFSISFSKGLSNIARISANKSKLWDSHYKIKGRKKH